MLLVLTLSSGFAQFAKHMCDDSGVIIAAESCSDADDCCSGSLEETDDHCSTTYVYMLTAKFKDAFKKVNIKAKELITILPPTNLEVKLVPCLNQAIASSFKYKVKQSPTESSFTGVFLI